MQWIHKGVAVEQYHVCVADDAVEAAEVLREGLELNDYKAYAVHNGTDALEVCRKEPIDLILLDVCMPDLDGYEVCRRLKEDPATKDIVVVFVTVKGEQEDVAYGFQLGASDYITKPYNLPMVMVRVDAALRARETQALLYNQDGSFLDTAYTDTLTGLRNRRFLLERLQEEVEKAHRYDFPVSCVVLDVDEIRAVDAELGPVSLDDLLAEVGMMLRNYSRTYDVLARYDGAKFAVVLPHTPLEQAKTYVSKLLKEVDGVTFSDPCSPTAARLSAGITCAKNGVAYGAEYVLGEAMRGLLHAKSLPGERVVARDLGSEE